METNNWKEFYVGDIFPKKRISKFSSIPEEEGKIPFVSSTSMNNGVSSFCDEEPINGNCITVSTNGDCFDAFYQPNPIAVSSDVDVLYNDKLNKFNALFICSILRLEKFKWAYGRKPKNDKVFKTKIKLPVKKHDDLEPDWDYMTSFVKKLWNDNLNSKNKNPLSLDVSKWKQFSYKEVFNEIYKGTAHIKENLEMCSCKNPNGITYVTRTDLNNGIVGFAVFDEELSIENGNAIIIGDTTATCFYQKDRFITGDHIVVLRSPNLNKYNGLFISTMVKNENYRFSYGRAFKKSLIEESFVLLPQTSDGEIDWGFMEDFIKSLKFADLI